ncbi:DUF2231 domain-containing protein [Dyella sp. Tek66A03]|uniref:DUF2231 domain-containing protein n=1 Tax=Dyella sp. Tek66A03 TaxID=3458298 RepID=UPI00403EE70B
MGHVDQTFQSALGASNAGRIDSERPGQRQFPLSPPLSLQPMNSHVASRRSIVAKAIYGLLNPIPFGFFVAALFFDIIYALTAVILWDRAAAWLIAIGLVFAIVPRLINLTQVWITSRAMTTNAERLDFWLNLVAVVAAIFNAFVHSRDAYAVVPAGVWLSALTVLLLAIGHIIIAVQHAAFGDFIHE